MLIIEYDGGLYHGFQIQKGSLTVQERLETAISTLAKEPVKVIGASRTDAGVHALGQVVNFESGITVPVSKLPVAINSLLPPDIRIKAAKPVHNSFHARFDAVEKTYVYRIFQAPIASVFYRHYALWIRDELDWVKIDKASRDLVGTHDFYSFAASGGSAKTSTRTIHACIIQKEQELTELRFTGNGFLYNMVRNIVGTLLEIGWGKRDVTSIPQILAARDRCYAGPTAQAHGLCLESVRYTTV